MKSPIKPKTNEFINMPVKKIFTLVFLKKNNTVLLGLKTRGLGKGLWNGFGGKVEKNESIDDCAKRELQEECNLIAKDLKHLGVVRYDVLRENYAHVVHIFTCTSYDGSEKASEEMNPLKWYEMNNIPFEQMWPDAPEWYPSMLAEKYFSARVIYADETTIQSSIIKEYGSLANALKLAE